MTTPRYRANLFQGDDGSPRYVQLRLDKRETGQVTAWFTGRVRGSFGHVFYRQMSDSPFHPQGIGISGSVERYKLRSGSYPGGSRILFRDLNTDQQYLVLRDYGELWDTAWPPRWAALAPSTRMASD